MDISNKRMAMTIAMILLHIGALSAQESNREQLLDLFHKANTAKNAQDTATAVSTYKKIIEMYPDMPEPYLQLGDIYYGDLSAQDQAAQCYRRYLELKPDSEAASEIKARIEKQTVTEEAETPPAVPRDTIPQEFNRRWASVEADEYGREMWIMDINANDTTILVRFNDTTSIYLHSDKRLSDMAKNELPGKKENGALTFKFEMNIGNIPQMPDRHATGIFHTHKFILGYDGHAFTGNIHRQLIERDSTDLILKEDILTCKFHPVPEDYRGFRYTPISREVKETDKKLIDIFNNKAHDSSTSALAMNDLACMYAEGIGAAKNIKVAIAYFQEAISKGNLFAMLNMARLYSEGIEIDKDTDKAIELYNKAFKSGYTDAMVLCGDAYMTKATAADSLQAIKCYQKVAIQKNPNAMYRLGCLYRDGAGVNKNHAKAWDYFQKALGAGHSDALTDAGICYRDGIMTGQDNAKALEYLNLAAEKGNVRAMMELSDMYMQGKGVAQDYLMSKEMLYKAMETEDTTVEGFNSIKASVKAILQDGQE